MVQESEIGKVSLSLLHTIWGSKARGGFMAEDRDYLKIHSLTYDTQEELKDQDCQTDYLHVIMWSTLFCSLISSKHGCLRVVWLLTWQLRAPSISCQQTRQKLYCLSSPSLKSHPAPLPPYFISYKVKRGRPRSPPIHEGMPKK